MEEELVEALRASADRLGEGATGRAATTGRRSKFPTSLDEQELHRRLGYALCSHGSVIDLFWRCRFSERSGSWGR